METLHLLWVVLTITVCIYAALFIHELGHFCCASFFGMDVSAIAIGFGPALLVTSVQGTPVSFNAVPCKASVKYNVGPTGSTGHTAYHKIAVSLSGPLASLSAALLLCGLYCAMRYFGPSSDFDILGLYRLYGHFPGIPFLFYWIYHLISQDITNVVPVFMALNFLIFCNGMLPFVENDLGKSIFNMIHRYDPSLEGKTIYSYLLISGGAKHILHLIVLFLSILDLYRFAH